MVSVSVVITSYNYGHLVKQTLRSVFDQTYRDLEVIFVDDASTDDTQQVLAGFRTERLKCILHSPDQRQWQSYSRNEAIRASSGRYVAFVDADDLWLPRKLERQVGLLESDGSLGMVYSDVERFDHATGKPLDRSSDSCRLSTGDILEPLVMSNFILSPSPVVRRAVLVEVGCWDVRIHKCEDWDLWIRIAERYRVGVVREVLARQRVHSEAVTMTEDLASFYASAADIIDRASARNPEKLGRIRRRAKSRLAYSVAKKYTARGQRDDALKMLLRGARSDPLNLRAYGGIARMLQECAFGKRLSGLIRLGKLGRLLP